MRSLVIVLAAFVITSAIGCANLTPQQKQQIKLAQANAQVSAAKIAAKAKVNDAKATASPVTNPIKSANVIVKKAEKPLGIIILISFLATAGSIGLLFTSLSAVSKISLPVSAAVLVLSGFGIIALPFLPWVALGVGGFLCLVAAYELYKNRAKLEAAVGLGSSPAPTPTPAPVKPAAAPAPYVRPM